MKSTLSNKCKMHTTSIIINENKENARQNLDKVIEILQENGIEVVKGEEINLPDGGKSNLPDCVEGNPDFYVVLGGDGTTVSAVRKNINANLPFLALNAGTVGFLTEEISDLQEVLQNHYISQRKALDVKFCDFSGKIAVNDIVLQRQPHGKMLKINVYVNGNLINSYKADGIILSTPTGSTAYNLSAGGSVIEPELEVVQITPICAHELSARPIVLSMNNKITIMHETSEAAELAIDGQEFYNIEKNQPIAVDNGNSFALIQSQKYSFYDRVKKKLK